MIVKVCGLKDPANIREVAAIPGIDLLGLIFYEKSPRFVDSQQVAETVKTFKNGGITGVFVNETTGEVVQKCTVYHLDYIQLHGNESPEYITSLKNILPERIKIIKAFSIKAEEDLSATSGYEGLCDFFLFDTPTTGFGGSGRTFDWRILQYYCGSTPFLLSGGIGPDSLESLHNFHHNLWAGIDLNSRFEVTPGIKNVQLLTNFIQQIKSKHL